VLRCLVLTSETKQYQVTNEKVAPSSRTKLTIYLFSESFSDEETMLFMKYTLSWHYAQYSGLVRHTEHSLCWLGRQSRTTRRADKKLSTEQRTFLSKFLGEFNSSFCEIHIGIATHIIHMPGGVERTFFITILEANGARREVPLWARD